MTNTSKKQLEANCKNAKKGGVKTDTGKAVSRLNALQHGLLCREALLPWEKDSELIDLQQRLRVTLKPEGDLELLLVDRIASGYWRLKRLVAVERSTMAYQHSDVMDFSFGGKDASMDWKRERAMVCNEDTEKLVRYESSLERSIYRALHELQRLQAARSGAPIPIPAAIDVTFDREV